MIKRQQFHEREQSAKREALRRGEKYIPPTFVQLHIQTYDDLNNENKDKLKKILNISNEMQLGYTKEALLHEIRKYDTSVLDYLLRNFEGY